MFRKKRSLWLGILGCFLMFGCSLWPWGANHETNYQNGVKAFESRQYDEASTLLRKIPPRTPQYENALKILQKIPLQKAQESIDRKDYAAALQELSAVGSDSPHYAAAQQLYHRTRYQVAVLKYQQVPASEKLNALSVMTQWIKKTGDPSLMVESIKLVGAQVAQESNGESLQALLKMIRELAESSNSKEVAQSALSFLFQAFERFEKKSDLRRDLIQTIAFLKSIG